MESQGYKCVVGMCARDKKGFWSVPFLLGLSVQLVCLIVVKGVSKAHGRSSKLLDTVAPNDVDTPLLEVCSYSGHLWLNNSHLWHPLN